MSYIIDHASLIKNDGLRKISLLINNNRIEFMRSTMDNFRFMRMDMSPFLLTPGYVMLDFSLQSSLTFKEYKSYFINKYIKKGCTTLITVTDIKDEKELLSKVKQRRHLMINSPIDYYIGVKVAFKALTPAVIRKCKRYNISIIFVELNEHDDLKNKSWGWLRDAMFSNPVTLIPYVNDEKTNMARKQKILNLWKKIMEENRLSSISSTLNEGIPISKEVLMRLGIYPIKGDIRVGGQVNYNLYKITDVHFQNGKPLLNTNPTVTVHQGKILNVNGLVSYVPGIGEECYISITGRFMPLSESI
ncbi:hypothetical protein [Metabacillus malikii]|uniref:Uncharacterized protein n=1 Tax=Metabacillus malikii TaxID=1504265 RepID=A0ABT9Z924_9BACI|nr:hypothetical protein [Metabacillus malikii]MDQ0228764.1 hypothetical protein [Metabacillus malikii]